MSDWHQRILGREVATLRRLGLRVTKARENVLRLEDGRLAVRIFRERPGRFVAELRSTVPDLEHSETRTEYTPGMALQAALLRYTDSLADGPLPCRLEAARLLFGTPVDVCALLPGDGWQGLRHQQAGLLFARGCERAHFTHWLGAPGGAVGCALSLLRTPDGHVLARGHGQGDDVSTAIATASADYLPRVRELHAATAAVLRALPPPEGVLPGLPVCVGNLDPIEHDHAVETWRVECEWPGGERGSVWVDGECRDLAEFIRDTLRAEVSR